MMRKTVTGLGAAAFGAVLLLALLLASCEPGTGLLAFFSASSFPAHLGLVEKAVDLSDKIEKPPNDGCYNCNHVHFMDGYIFLSANDSQLFIFNEDLQLLRGPIDHGYPAYGTLGFSDFSTFFLGEFEYNKADFAEINSTMAVRYGFGFFDGVNKYVVNQNMETLELYVNDVPAQQYLDLQTTKMKNPRFSSLAYSSSLNPDTAFFFEEDYSDRNTKAIFIDSSIYTQAGYFSEVAARTPVNFPPAEDGRYYYTHYTDDDGTHPGFVGVWNGTMRLVASDGQTIVSSISGYNTDRLAMAFDIDGKFFYLYDADQRALFRCRTWWNKR